ncbi:hypothetical protein [Campylobacter sp. JMF_03 NE3]|uniref:hypothetical protein n=1 Tax=Campylobacter sp. JMF_03 NE3 TaxID=2983831 RepID=UPI0022E9D52B|nr:hypothetical protein [Campylobacter sp. JMF_03 NE3]MDA3053501.1 hypothetical protein [Campylobacter sp. JMF_03 NE3]
MTFYIKEIDDEGRFAEYVFNTENYSLQTQISKENQSLPYIMQASICLKIDSKEYTCYICSEDYATLISHLINKTPVCIQIAGNVVKDISNTENIFTSEPYGFASKKCNVKNHIDYLRKADAKWFKNNLNDEPEELENEF